jgi:hypothetical protein
MRDYAKVSPKFWIGKTGKALKALGPEAVIVGMYLMTNQHANMLGLYYLSLDYIAVDTGLGLEGAKKGLQSTFEAGFCQYDEASEMVWVIEMAAYQISDQLEAKDNRCKGVQREYDALPENPYLEPFFEKYEAAFHMTSKRVPKEKQHTPFKAPSKPLRSQEQEQEQEQENINTSSAGADRSQPGFVRFWSTWPKSQRKVGKAECAKRWKARRLETEADALVAHVQAMLGTQQWREGFEPAPLTYINQRRWQDDVPSGLLEGAPDASTDGHWLTSATGITVKGAELGIVQEQGEPFPSFKARVIAAAGLTEADKARARADLGVHI